MDFVALLKLAIADSKSGNWYDALMNGAKALAMALEALKGKPLMQSPVPCPFTPCADLDACCAELESRLPVDDGTMHAINPALIMTILPYVLDFLKLLWEKRQ